MNNNKYPIGELTQSASQSSQAADEKAKKKRDQKKSLIKLGAIGVLTAVTIIIGTLSWFASNKAVESSGMVVRSAALPFDIATKGASVRNSDLIAQAREDYTNGNKETFTKVENGEYYTAGSGDGLLLRYTPLEDDPATEDIDESQAPDIGPGSHGELSLYLIAKKDGVIDAYIDLDVVSFKAVKDGDNERLIEISDTLTTESGLTDDQIEECREADGFLKGHILFFEEKNSSDDYSYKSPVIDGRIHFHIDDAENGSAYKVPIYWTWTNTLGQIALKNNTNVLLDGIPVVEMTPDMGTEEKPTDKALVLKYLKDNKDTVFKDLDILSGLTAEQKAEYEALENDEEKAAYLAEINVDTWIDNADTRIYFDLLSEGYNNADFSIGTSLDYFMIEVTVKTEE